jgi:DNA-binding GntR family transcriptional regulator
MRVKTGKKHNNHSKFRPRGIAEGISLSLVNAILNGTLQGGEQLTEVGLQEEFGVSRSPVREALRDLEKKGLVVLKPRRGTFVKAVTQKDIRENFRVRSVLEGLAAKEAYERMSEAEIASMERICREMEKAAGDNDTSAYWELHNDFHNVYLKACENRLLIDIVENLRMHNLWYRHSGQYYEKDLHEDFLPHQELMGHFRKRAHSEEDIEMAVRKHIELGLSDFVRYMEELGQPHKEV